jgi:acyl dehydratase
MLHALATGVGMNPVDGDQLRFAYDDAALPLLALPTLPIVLGWVDFVRDPRSRDPRLGIDPDRVVVGQAALQLHAPIPTSGHGVTRTSFVGVVDKGEGRGALVCVRRRVLDPDSEPLATIDTWLFIRGAGGFGGPRDGGPARIGMPERSPDAVVEQSTPGHLALLYRLVLGDHNAVHADPAHALRGGFDRPILHGLATFSLALHAAIAGTTGSLAANACRLASAHATLARPVYPGDALRTEAWHDGNDVLFRTSAPGRGVVVIEGGRLALSTST